MKKKIFNITVIFSIITLTSKLLGLVRDSMLAKNYGVSNLTDAYYVAITVPTFFYQVVGASIMTVFIPFYKEELINRGNKSANEFANKILTLITSLMVVIMVLIFIKPEILVNLMAPKFTAETHRLTAELIKISIFNLIFMSISSISCGILQSNKEFLSTSLMGILLNLPVLVYLIVLKGRDIYMLTLVTGVGFGLQVAIQIPFLKRINYKIRLNFKFKDKNLIKMLIAVIPIIIGIGVQHISVIIDKVMGSSLDSGSITILDFATKINGVVYAILATSILTISYPQLATYLIDKDYKDLINKVEKTAITLMFILIPISVLIIIFKNDIITVLYSRGSFTNENTITTAIVLACFIIAIPFMALRDLFANVFYSMKNTKTPAVNGVVAVIINIILNIILTPMVGISGIAIATSIAMIFSSILISNSLRKTVCNINFKNIFINVGKIICSTIISITIVYIIRNHWHELRMNNIKVMLLDGSVALIGAVFYLYILNLLNMECAVKFVMDTKMKINEVIIRRRRNA